MDTELASGNTSRVRNILTAKAAPEGTFCSIWDQPCKMYIFIRVVGPNFSFDFFFNVPNVTIRSITVVISYIYVKY